MNKKYDTTTTGIVHALRDTHHTQTVEEIPDEFELYRQCQYLDKLYDELAKGRKLEKILHVEKK